MKFGLKLGYVLFILWSLKMINGSHFETSRQKHNDDSIGKLFFFFQLTLGNIPYGMKGSFRLLSGLRLFAQYWAQGRIAKSSHCNYTSLYMCFCITAEFNYTWNPLVQITSCRSWSGWSISNGISLFQVNYIVNFIAVCIWSKKNCYSSRLVLSQRQCLIASRM